MMVSQKGMIHAVCREVVMLARSEGLAIRPNKISEIMPMHSGISLTCWNGFRISMEIFP